MNDDIICYCPVCQGEVLFEDSKRANRDGSNVSLIEDKMYCPRCEMLVAPVIAKVDSLGGANPAFHATTPEDHGRTRAAGSNAGGSQNGGMADEGATQWRTDPHEAERNTWSDKD